MKKYENFCQALINMKDIYNYEEPYDNVVLTGLVGLYEITFEQSWKMMKEILQNHGYEEGATGSPKIILKTAYKAGMIKDEDLWLKALRERNNVTHSYNQNIALSIISQAKEKFYDMFCQLKKEVDEIGYNKTNPACIICRCRIYYYQICTTDILSPNFLSNLLNQRHLLPLIFIS